jgi:hypothetical protein
MNFVGLSLIKICKRMVQAATLYRIMFISMSTQNFVAKERFCEWFCETPCSGEINLMLLYPTGMTT